MFFPGSRYAKLSPYSVTLPNGTVNVASSDPEAVKKALDIIKGLTAEPEVGTVPGGHGSKLPGLVLVLDPQFSTGFCCPPTPLPP